MFLTPLNRIDLLEVLPRAREVAEVGTYRGRYAKEIAERANPDRLHVIDPWDEEAEYSKKYNVRESWDSIYDQAMAWLSPHVSAGKVIVHRDYSLPAAEAFEDGSLDWVYVDAMHSYEACLADLRAFSPKVKADGFILGHDFSNTSLGRRVGFGVIRAVREFVAEEDYELLAVTIEDAPSYVIVKEPGEHREAFLRSLVAHDPRVVQVPESFFDQFDQYAFEDANETRRQLFRFQESRSTDAGSGRSGIGRRFRRLYQQRASAPR